MKEVSPISRRAFLRTSSRSVLGCWGGASLASFSIIKRRSYKSVRKPLALHRGGTVGLIAPASPVPEKKFDEAIQNIEQLDLKVRYSKRLKSSKGFLAGDDTTRLRDLHEMIEDQTIQGIFCIRGGYGTMRLLRDINYRILRQNIKPLIGFSDITALHLTFYEQLEWIGFHGPMGTSNFTDFTTQALWRILEGRSTGYTLRRYAQSTNYATQNRLLDKCFTIRKGRAEGKLIGGNLTIINSLLGTPWAPNFDHKIVCIEEVGERPYRIDRLFTQLLLSGALKQSTRTCPRRF